MHLTITLLLILIAILVIGSAGYLFVSKMPLKTSIIPTSGTSGTSSSSSSSATPAPNSPTSSATIQTSTTALSVTGEAVAVDALEQEINSATANISTSDIENSIASQ